MVHTFVAARVSFTREFFCWDRNPNVHARTRPVVGVDEARRSGIHLGNLTNQLGALGTCHTLNEKLVGKERLSIAQRVERAVELFAHMLHELRPHTRTVFVFRLPPLLLEICPLPLHFKFLIAFAIRRARPANKQWTRTL